MGGFVDITITKELLSTQDAFLITDAVSLSSNRHLRALINNNQFTTIVYNAYSFFKYHSPCCLNFCCYLNIFFFVERPAFLQTVHAIEAQLGCHINAIVYLYGDVNLHLKHKAAYGIGLCSSTIIHNSDYLKGRRIAEQFLYVFNSSGGSSASNLPVFFVQNSSIASGIKNAVAGYHFEIIKLPLKLCYNEQLQLIEYSLWQFCAPHLIFVDTTHNIILLNEIVEMIEQSPYAELTIFNSSLKGFINCPLFWVKMAAGELDCLFNNSQLLGFYLLQNTIPQSLLITQMLNTVNNNNLHNKQNCHTWIYTYITLHNFNNNTTQTYKANLSNITIITPCLITSLGG